jgi:hypothetical protein
MTWTKAEVPGSRPTSFSALALDPVGLVVERQALEGEQLVENIDDLRHLATGGLVTLPGDGVQITGGRGHPALARHFRTAGQDLDGLDIVLAAALETGVEGVDPRVR